MFYKLYSEKKIKVKEFTYLPTLTSCFGLMTDSAVVDSALVVSALRKSGLISNGCSGFIIYLCGLRQIRPYIKWKRIIKKLKLYLNLKYYLNIHGCDE